VSTDSSGTATLTSWTLGTVAGANTLQATSIGLTGSPITFTATGIPGAAAALTRTQSIAGAASGAAFTTQPHISVVDANGNIVTSDNSTVVAATVSTGGSLVGTTTATSVSGIATFTDLGLTGTSGTQYTVTFSASGLTSVDQSVMAATGAAARLVVATSPAGATYGNTWTTQPVVQIQDSGGNLVTADSSTSVTISIAGQTLSGTTTVTAVNGVATFGGLSLTAAPATYPLVFTASSGIPFSGSTPTVVLGRSSQSISFAALVDRTYGAAPFSVSASATSGLTSEFSSRTPTVCSVSGSAVSILRAGLCTIRASQSGSANFTAASPEDQSFTVAQAVPTFGWSNSTATFGDAPYAIAAPTPSTPGSFAYSSATTSVISVSGSQITVNGGGSSVITATFTPADAVNYVTGGTVTSTIQVDRAAQSTLSVTSILGTYGTPVTLASSGGAGSGGVTFALTSAGSAGCSLTGGGSTLTAATAGTCSVTATKAQDDDYLAATSAPATVTFERAAQASVTLLSTGGTYGTPLTLLATGGSGTGIVSFAVTSAGSAGCSLTGGGSTLTPSSAGTCTVTATRAEDANHVARSSPATVVTFDRAAQTVTFGGLADRTYGDAPFPVVASTSSGLTVAIVSTTTPVCTVSGVTVTIVGAGTCSLNAVQAGSADYLPAVTVTRPFEVARANQGALSISSADTVPYGASVPLTVSGGSGTGAVTYSVVAGACSVSSGVLTLGDVGSLCRIEALKQADANYFSAVSPEQSITVVRAGQRITFATSVASPTPGTSYSPVAVSVSEATDSSTGIPVLLSIASSSSEVCTLDSGVITFEAVGECVIEANGGETSRYTAPPQQTQTITVVPVPTPTPASAVSPVAVEASAPTTPPRDLPVSALTAAPPAIPLGPGAESVLIGGVPVAVTTVVNPESTGLVLAGTDWDLSLAPRGTDGRPAPLGTDGGLVLAPSGSLPLAASGYSANSSVFVYLMSTPVLLGVLQVDASGAMTGELKLPVNLAPGAHTLQINGYSTAGLLRSVSLGVTVSESVSAARTMRARVVFDYGSDDLTTRSRLALRALVHEMREMDQTAGSRDSSTGPTWRTTIVGAVRAEGATVADRLLAMRRAQAVAAFLRSRGLVSAVRTVTRPTPVSNLPRDRFVEVSMVAR
jgi:outer membrane protein OmpA-like peptidoglycan-associated protein